MYVYCACTRAYLFTWDNVVERDERTRALDRDVEYLFTLCPYRLHKYTYIYSHTLATFMIHTHNTQRTLVVCERRRVQHTTYICIHAHTYREVVGVVGNRGLLISLAHVCCVCVSLFMLYIPVHLMAHSKIYAHRCVVCAVAICAQGKQKYARAVSMLASCVLRDRTVVLACIFDTPCETSGMLCACETECSENTHTHTQTHFPPSHRTSASRPAFSWLCTAPKAEPLSVCQGANSKMHTANDNERAIGSVARRVQE